MKRSILALVATLVMVFAATPANAHVVQGADLSNSQSSWTTFWEVQLARIATARYHSLERATDPNRGGYEAFAIDPNVGGSTTDLPGNPTCFDDPDKGGMGVHYVKDIDGDVSVVNPEALVYEVGGNGKARLVGLEYIVPVPEVENDDGEVVNLPRLFGRDFHRHSYLPVYILHVWIWKYNPSGMFADFNPRVGGCPS